MFNKMALLALVFSIQNSFLFADNLPTTVNVGLNKAFVPIGFDDNDRGQLAVEGMFNNTCYRIGPHALRVDELAKTISIQQQAYLYGGICLQMQVPFTQIIDVGVLSSGTYTLIDRETGGVLGMLPIGKGKNVGPDDYLYAPIGDAYVVNDTHTKKNSLVITGSFGDRCSDFEKIDVLFQDQVLVVQPIIKRTTEATCTPMKTRFLKVIELEKDIHGMYLLHVRSLNGQAINKMVDLQ